MFLKLKKLSSYRGFDRYGVKPIVVMFGKIRHCTPLRAQTIGLTSLTPLTPYYSFPHLLISYRL